MEENLRAIISAGDQVIGIDSIVQSCITPGRDYYYIGKKVKEPTNLIMGEKPCWFVRALQSLVGIHWIKSQK